MPPARRTAASEKVHFNLDTFEREGGEREPYTAVIGGKKITFVDPADLPWQVLEEIDNPDRFADLVIEKEEDRTHFLTFPMKAWQLNGLMESYMSHYGLGSKGNAGA